MTSQDAHSTRPSRIPWVARVPDDWDVLPLMAVARESQIPNTGVREQNLLSLSYGNIVPKDINTLDGLLPESFETYQVVHPGMIVFRFTDLQNDKRSLRSGLVRAHGIITSAYLAVEPHSVDSSYFAYLMRSYDTTKVFYGMGGGLRQSIKYGDVRRLPILVPPPATQQAIADFLDRETAEIDAFIADQERLIELLTERRRRVVSEAVEVQAPGWRSVRLGWIATIGNGSTPLRENPQYWEGGSFPWLNSTVVNQDRVTSADQFVTQVALKECHLPIVPRGSVLVGITGQGRTRGMSTLLDIEATINQHMAYLTPRPDVLPEFVLAALTAAYEELRLISEGGGSTKGALTCEDLKHYRIALPDTQEQHRIVDSLAQVTAATTQMVADAQEAIMLSRERRVALITAAVTGQLDVRTGRTKNVGGTCQTVSTDDNGR